MSEFKISYLLTTYNKLPYLRQVLGRLVAARLPYEEIVVADGGSTDGSVAYLQGLFERGHIQQFESARDKGEAHGFNKCILRARGEILKLITDDDAFNYSVIRACADFMLENPAVDVMLGHCGEVTEENPAVALVPEVYAVHFREWLATQQPFCMVGLPLIVRRSAIPFLGLFSNNTILVDAEYTYRISSLNANIAWCDGLVSVHMGNGNGNSNRMGFQKVMAEVARMRTFYAGADRRDAAKVARALLEAGKRPLRNVKRALFDRLGWAQYQNPELYPTDHQLRAGETHLDMVYRVCDELMQTQNQLRQTTFIHRGAPVAPAAGVVPSLIPA